MSKTWPVLAVVLFCVATDWVEADWPLAVFRASACLLCALYLLIGERRLSWLIAPPAALAAWGLLQLALHSTVWRYATWLAVLQWIAYAALVFSALQSGVRGRLKVLAWFGGAFSLYAIAQNAGWRGAGERTLGTFPNHNHYAALMELLFPVALWRLVRDRERAVFAVCAALMFISVAVGGSRAGIALLLAELAYLGLRATRRRGMALAGMAVAVALAGAWMWPRWALLSTNEPYESRQATALASVRMVRERPLLGFGLGTWANVYPAYAESDTGFRLIHADNDWLEWAAEDGLPFAAVLLILAAMALRSAWKEPWCVGCVAVMIHALFEFPLQKQAIRACFFLVLAAAQPSIARRKHL